MVFPNRLKNCLFQHFCKMLRMRCKATRFLHALRTSYSHQRILKALFPTQHTASNPMHIQISNTCLRARPVDRLSWPKGTDDQRKQTVALSWGYGQTSADRVRRLRVRSANHLAGYPKSLLHVYMPGPWTALMGQMDRRRTEAEEGTLMGPKDGSVHVVTFTTSTLKK